jgi:hypothetical protein
VCEWAAWADFTAVRVEVRQVFAFPRKEKLFVPTSGTTIQRAHEAQSNFAQLLTLEVKAEIEIGDGKICFRQCRFLETWSR